MHNSWLVWFTTIPYTALYAHQVREDPFFLADYWFSKKSNILYTLSCNFLANKNKEHLSDTPILITHANIYNLRVTPRVPSTNHFLNWVAARKGRIWLSGGGFLGKLCLKFSLYKSTHLNYRIILIGSRKLNWLHQPKNLRQINLCLYKMPSFWGKFYVFLKRKWY